MVLTRSDSSQSAWVVPTAGDEGDDIPDQRRIRNLSAVLVRNLSLDPARDELSSTTFPSTRHRRLSRDLGSPTSTRPPLPSRDSWAESLSGEAGPSRSVGRRRAGSNASWSGGLGAADQPGGGEEREIVLDGKKPFVPRTRAKRSSSAATLLTRPSTSRIEEEDLDASPQAGPSVSTSFPSTSSTRPRSSSRLSASSVQSSSTIRQAPRLPTTQQPPERPPPPTTSQSAQKEKRRREEAVQRRLLDSFVSLELVAPAEEDGVAEPSSASEQERRKRGNTVVVPSASASSSSRMRRSDSGSSIGSFQIDSSPRKSMRRRTRSSSFLPSSATASSSQPTASTSTSPPPPSQPFYVSPLSASTMHPSFPIDRDHFVLPPFHPSSSASSPPPPSSPALDDLDGVDVWAGLRESRVRAKVFVRRRGGEGKGKGKEKARDEDQEREDEGWTCLIEWEVAFDGLTSLGRDPTAFPTLPPNTLIFALSPTTSFSPSFSCSSHSSSANDVEYFTAPLPLLHRALRRTLRASRTAREGKRERLREAVSEDELSDYFDEDESSSGEEEEGPFGSLRGGKRSAGGEDDGNLSDPGVSTSTSSARPRSGTLTLRTRRDTRRRVLAERLRAEEERRKRKEIVEKSRRETRMVKAAGELEVRALWEGEREMERVREEIAAAKGRVEKGLEETGAALKREKAELRDRVEDLEAVRAAEEEELEEEREALNARRAEIQARRARLEAAKLLDEDNTEQLERWRDELDGSDRALAKLASSARTRRTQLITLLSSIFPIEPVLPTDSSPSPPPLLFTICALPLPNSSFSPPYNDDDLLSSALGYAAQLTQMLAAYLGVPLCYPVKCCGSRSTVTDGISMMKGPRAFPLYGKGVDGYRFDYGVFLLNKNIEQLMYSQSLTVLDLRNTLPNLKTLVLSLSYDPSHADYRASTLLPVAPFLPDSAVDDDDLVGTSAAETPRSRSPSPAGSSDDSAAGSSASGTADSTPALSTGSLPALEAGDGSTSAFSSGARMSRSPSLASTIRARSMSPTPTVRAADGSGSGDDSGRTSSPSPSVRSNVSGDANGHANGAATVEKHLPPRSSSPSALPPAVPLKLKTQLSKTGQRARSRSSSGSSTASGYGKRFADGLWSAVAGRPAAAGGAERDRGKGGSREDGGYG
ncbi:hypothetical protein JCM6882_007981 [Rhodosporidiobolus microsporus]